MHRVTGSVTRSLDLVNVDPASGDGDYYGNPRRMVVTRPHSCPYNLASPLSPRLLPLLRGAGEEERDRLYRLVCLQVDSSESTCTLSDDYSFDRSDTNSHLRQSGSATSEVERAEVGSIEVDGWSGKFYMSSCSASRKVIDRLARENTSKFSFSTSTTNAFNN